jgi:hypothetical protein
MQDAKKNKLPFMHGSYQLFGFGIAWNGSESIDQGELPTVGDIREMCQER